MSAPPKDPPGEPMEDDRLTRCPCCGTMADSGQEYCLECATRLPHADGLAARLGIAWKRRLKWYPGDWIWPALGLVVIAALGGGAAILSTRVWSSASAPPILVATNPTISVSIPTHTTVPTLSTVPPPATTAPPVVPRAHKPKPPKRSPTSTVVVWPAGHDAYTLILSFVPKPNGHAAALATARSAQAAGLRRVGVLDSDGVASLHPGYWVVFSDIYGSYSQANAQRERAHALGYGAAYARRVTG